MAADAGEWAGIPLPLEGERLIIDKSYRFAEVCMSIGAKTEEDDKYRGAKVVNVFWSWKYRSEIAIWLDNEGKRHWGVIPGVHHFGYDLQTLGCSEAWSIEAEHFALRTLAEKLDHHRFKQYLMTGMFLETSNRSGVTYCFRKLKPTIAMSGRTGNMKILAALCLHAIGYYAGSWAGAMCPTDEVLGHLMLMRGDEKLFWRRANHHAAYKPEAGL